MDERTVIAGQIKEEETMTNTEKRWSTPRLRIFGRTRTQERVLSACKSPGFAGPQVAYGVPCEVLVPGDARCNACSEQTGT
jgi:hypothetical protein